ncbi:helix-turn-helix domain-containing protein [Variovorax soli]|uniref:Winged helix-turn-helix domain-containing protein n=1 Tax=Variovorax soli TaxID=376815 RepID=A0ABU1NFP2_9BURK|nr:helix-turn-helix domain-containing protein [Variovorax soli]MDR6537290.1 hypothetical protein [Variovorax soli]
MDRDQTTPPEKIADLQAIRATYTGSASNAQRVRLLAALGRYAINTFEAMRYLDVYHCPARVLQLRKLGHRIETHWQTITTEAGAAHRVGMYVLQSGETS